MSGIFSTHSRPQCFHPSQTAPLCTLVNAGFSKVHILSPRGELDESSRTFFLQTAPVDATTVNPQLVCLRSATRRQPSPPNRQPSINRFESDHRSDDRSLAYSLMNNI